MEELKVRGYTDPRTGRYVSASEATQEEFEGAYALMQAARFYWDGPLEQKLVLDKDNALKRVLSPVFPREVWLEAQGRKDWLDSLTEEQRQMLAECLPPEELVPPGAS